MEQIGGVCTNLVQVRGKRAGGEDESGLAKRGYALQSGAVLMTVNDKATPVPSKTLEQPVAIRYYVGRFKAGNRVKYGVVMEHCESRHPIGGCLS
jgi:hypothetical protein